MRITIPKRMFGKPIEGDLEKYLSEQSTAPSVDPGFQHPIIGNTIDSAPALNGENKTQNQWIEYFNSQNKRMISAPDLYLAGKLNLKVIDSLRDDFNTWLISGTQIHYDPASLEGQIIHYAKSSVVNPIILPKLLIPNYSSSKSLTDVLGSSDGLKYLQTLFHTSDSKEEIVKNLEALSNKKSSKTYIWTPDQSSRAGTPVRAVRFVYYYGVFRIVGNSYPVSDLGRSRGVQ